MTSKAEVRFLLGEIERFGADLNCPCEGFEAKEEALWALRYVAKEYRGRRQTTHHADRNIALTLLRACYGYTLNDIADVTGISKGRARQITDKTLRDMRGALWLQEGRYGRKLKQQVAAHQLPPAFT